MNVQIVKARVTLLKELEDVKRANASLEKAVEVLNQHKENIETEFKHRDRQKAAMQQK